MVNMLAASERSWTARGASDGADETTPDAFPFLPCFAGVAASLREVGSAAALRETALSNDSI